MKHHWIVCDDVDPQSPVTGAAVIRPNWRWQPGMNTQAQSMALLLSMVPDGASVVICEDDDVYLPDHLQTMAEALKTHELVGQRVSLYYNIKTRKHRELPGTYHASLGATALRGSALKLLQDVCARQPKCLDMELWREFTGSKKLLETRTAIGVKGMTGRDGIGVGHREEFGDPDPSGQVLRSWIGEHAEKYLS
jgi:hypothetical protein